MEERLSASEDEAEADSGWEDWADEDNAAKCLFCAEQLSSASLTFEHCRLVHGFDFSGLRRASQLDFYDCIRLLNFIRFEVSSNQCWNCSASCGSAEELLQHLNAAKHSEMPGSAAWKDDKFLTPTLESDELLCGFDDGDEEAEEAEDPGKEAILDEFKAKVLEGDDLKELMTTVDEAIDEAAAADAHSASSAPLDTAVLIENSKKKDRKVTFSVVADKEIRRVNSNYFSSYGQYGIHKEMLNDKARTQAYETAVLNNPKLLQNATVLDIGCGTGILSLFAVKAGASKVIAVDASEKMASVARQIADDNLYPAHKLTVVCGMIEELDDKLPLDVSGADVIVSEWMGYCLLYESMLGSVLHARDRWLKPGGAILPDVAELYIAGFGKGGTSLPFWDSVYGFSMKHIGEELLRHAAEYPIIDVIDSKDVVTDTCLLKSFDIANMKPEDVDFNAEFELKPASSTIEVCYGVVIWFDTLFSSRFCSQHPVVLSTSPFAASTTHWAQTILTFKEPVAMSSSKEVQTPSRDAIGSSVNFPAAALKGRVSIARSCKHRSVDVSLETTAVSANGESRCVAVQIFDI